MRGTCALVLAVGVCAAASSDDKEKLDAIVAKLNNKNAKTRIAGLEEAGRMGKGAAPILKEVCDCLVDSWPGVAKTALVTIEKIDRELYKPLSDYLLSDAKTVKGRPRPNSPVRAKALEELAKLGQDAKPISTVIITRLKYELNQQRPSSEVPLLEEIVSAAGFDDEFSITTIAGIAKTPASAKGGAARSRPRNWAIEYLARWSAGDANRLKVSLPIIKVGLSDTQSVAASIQAATTLGPDAAELLPMLKELKLSNDKTVRDLATKAVEKIEKRIGYAFLPAIRSRRSLA